jgi:hypothetical protein
VKFTHSNGLEYWLKPTGGNQSSAAEFISKVVEGDHGTWNVLVRIFVKNIRVGNTVLVRSTMNERGILDVTSKY